MEAVVTGSAGMPKHTNATQPTVEQTKESALSFTCSSCGQNRIYPA